MQPLCRQALNITIDPVDYLRDLKRNLAHSSCMFAQHPPPTLLLQYMDYSLAGTCSINPSNDTTTSAAARVVVSPGLS